MNSFCSLSLPSFRFRFASSFFSSARKKCTSAFFLSRSFVFKEIAYAHRHFTKLPETKYFINLAQRVHSCVKGTLFAPSQTPVDHNTPAPQISNDLAEALAAITHPKFLESTEEMEIPPHPPEQLSLFRHVESSRCQSSALDLDHISLINASEGEIIQHPKFINFVPSYKDVMEQQQLLLSSARQRQNVILSIAQEGTLSYEPAVVKMRQLARDTASEVEALAEGESMGVYVPLSPGSHLLTSRLIQHAGQRFVSSGASKPEKEWSFDSIKQNLLGKIVETLKQQDLMSQCSNLMTVFNGVRDKFLGEKPGDTKKAVFDSLEKDLEVLLREYAKEHKLPENIWEKLNELPEVLAQKIESVLTSAFSIFEESFEKLNQKFASVIPTEVEMLMEEKNYFLSKQFAYFVIKKGPNGVQLTVYPSKQERSFTPAPSAKDSPLVYENLTLSQINQDFFYRAFTYQAFLEQQGVSSFTLHHLRKGLLDPLGIAPTGRRAAVKRDFKDHSLAALEFTLTLQTIVDSTEKSQTEVQRDLAKAKILFKFDLLEKGWAYLYHHQTRLSGTAPQKMIAAVHTLAKELEDPEYKKLFSEDEHRILGATLWHVAKSLQKMKATVKDLSKASTQPILIPAKLQEKLRENFPIDEFLSHVDSIKELFQEFFGEASTAALNQILDEMFPKAELQKGDTVLKPQHTPSALEMVGFKSVRGVEELRHVKHRWKGLKNRLSLLTTYRLVAALCDYCNHSVVGFFTEIFLKALLITLFPGVSLSAYFVKTILDKAALHGPAIIISTFPKPIADGLIAFLGVYREIQSYLWNRMGILLARTVLRNFLKENFASFNKFILEQNSKLTREGTLNFDLEEALKRHEGKTLPEGMTQLSPSTKRDHSVTHKNGPLTEIVEKDDKKRVDTQTDQLFRFRLDERNDSDAIFQLYENYHASSNIEIKSRKNTILTDFYVSALLFGTMIQNWISPKNHDASSSFTLSRNLIFDSEELLRVIPYPNFRLLKDWMENHQDTLSAEEKHRVNEIVTFFENNISNLSFPFDPLSCMDAEKNSSEPIDGRNLFTLLHQRFFSSDEKFSVRKVFNWLRQSQEYRCLIPLLLACARCDHHFQTIEHASSVRDFLDLERDLIDQNLPSLLQKGVEMVRKEHYRSKFLEILQYECSNTMVNSLVQKRLKDKEVLFTILTRFVRKLPIPEKGTPSLWQQMDPAWAIERIYEILRFIRFNQDPGIERYVSCVSLFAMGFHLSSLLPNNCIEESDLPNIEPFLAFISDPRKLRGIQNGATLRQVEQVLAFFQLDLKYKAGFLNAAKSLEKIKRFRIKFSDHKIRFAIPEEYFEGAVVSLNHKTKDFYKRVKSLPKVQRKLREKVPVVPASVYKKISQGMNLYFMTGKAVVIAMVELNNLIRNDNFKVRLRLNDDDEDLLNSYVDQYHVLPKSLRRLREMEFLTLSSLETKKLPAVSEIFQVYDIDDSNRSGKILDALSGQAKYVMIPEFNKYKLQNASFLQLRSREMETGAPSPEDEAERPGVMGLYHREFFLRVLEFIYRRIEAGEIDKPIDEAAENKPEVNCSMLFQITHLSLYLLLRDEPDLLPHLTKKLMKLIEMLEGRQSKTFHAIDVERSLILLGQMGLALNCPHAMANMEKVRCFMRHRVSIGTAGTAKLIVNSYVEDQYFLQMNPEQQRSALADIAYGFVLIPNPTFIMWKPLIIDRLNKDPLLVGEVMDRIGRLLGFSTSPNDVWEGVYPHFTNGRVAVDLSKEAFFSAENPSKASDIQELCPIASQANLSIPRKEAVDLSKVPLNLALLSWFQPLSDIDAFVEVSGNSRVFKICFPKVAQLSFYGKAVDGASRLYSENTFPGYFIAERQKIDSLISFSRYLLLENDRGEKKVILLPLHEVLLGAQQAAVWMDTEVTAGMFKFIEGKFESDLPPVVCSLDCKGNLVPETVFGRAYLLLFYLTRKEEGLVQHHLKALQDDSRKGVFSDDTLRLLYSIILSGLISDQMECAVVCSTIQMIYSNHFLFSNGEALKKLSFEWRIFINLAAQCSLLSLLRESKVLPLNEYEELLLLKGIASESRAFIDSKIPESFVNFLDRFGIGYHLESILLHPELSKRYAQLQAIHLQSKLGAAKYLLLSSSGGGAAASSTQQTNQNSLLEGMSFNDFIQDVVEIHREKNTVIEFTNERLDAFLAYLRIFDFSRDLNEAPVTSHAITKTCMNKYFWFYLCLTLDLNDDEGMTEANLELFKEKQAVFKKTLLSMVGNYDPSVEIRLRILKIASHHPDILSSLFDLVSKIPSLSVTQAPLREQVPIEEPSSSAPTFLVEQEGSHRPSSKPQYTLAHLRRFSACVKAEIQLRNGVYVGYENVRERMKEFLNCFSTCESSYFSNLNQNVRYLALLSKPVIQHLKNSKTQKKESFSEGLVEFLGKAPAFQKAKTVYETAKTVKGVYDHVVEFKRHRDRLLHDSALVERQVDAALACDNLPLNELLIRELEERETAVNNLFSLLLLKYFDENPVAATPEEITNQETAPLVFHHEDSVGRVFDELLQSHRDYVARPVLPAPAYTLKQNVESEFIQDFTLLREATTKRIQEERAAIVSYANSKLDHIAAYPKEIDEFFIELKRLDFDEIFSMLIKGEDEQLMELAGLNESEVSHLKSLLNLHLVGASRWESLFQTFDKTLQSRQNSGETLSFTSVGRALATRRAYSFEGMRSRILTAFLMFEARTGMILWSKQAITFRRLVESNDTRIVLELIMGSGKTAFGMPFINFVAADKKTLLINIWPKATAPTNIQEIGKHSRMVYHQGSWAFAFTRSKKTSFNTLEALYITLRGAMRRGEPVNMTREDLQALELNFIDLLFQNTHSPDDKNRLNAYRQILLLIKRQGKLNVDEAHVNFYTGIDLNYPFGQRQRLSANACKTMERVFNWLIELNHPLMASFRDPDAILHKIDENTFKERISPYFAERAFDFFNIPDEHRDSFISYMNNQGEIPSFLPSHKQFEEICLTRGMSLILLPFSFASVAQVEFAISKKGIQEFARPAEGNDKPNEDSLIESPYEAYVKSSILYLKKGLSDHQCVRLIQFFQNKALDHSKKYHIAPENTNEAEYFAHMTHGANLFDPVVLKDQSLHALLKNNDSFILAYVRHMVGKTIEFYPEKCSSNSHNFASMAQSFYSCTGTPDNIDTYAEGTVLLPDPGTQGECVALIRKKCGTEPIDILPSVGPQQMIQEVMHRYFSPGSLYSCVIERGALFRGISNVAVAQQMLEYTRMHRPDIKGIVFWDSSNCQMVLENDASEPVAFSQSRLHPHERITYFDESHTFAADIPQPPRAIGLVTFGEHTRLDGLFQAILRMRELNRAQSIRLVTNESVLHSSNAAFLTPDGVIEFVARKTKPFRKKENFQSAPKLMKNVLRRALLDYFLEIDSPSNLIERASRYRSQFIDRNFHQPSECFSDVTLQGPPSDALTIYKNRLHPLIQKGPFSKDQKREMIERISRPVTEGDYPDEVTLHLGQGISPLQLGQTVQVQQNEEEQEQEEEEIDVEQQQQQNILVPDIEVYPKRYWTKNFDLYNLDEWLAPIGIGVQIHALKDLCSFRGVECLQNVLPDNLLATNNYTPVKGRWDEPTSFVPFLSASQQPTYQLLVIETPEKRSLLLLDPKEAHFLRKRLRRDRDLGPNHPRPPIRFAMYDLVHNVVVAHGYEKLDRRELHASKKFVQNIAQIKFLNGMVSYTPKEIRMMKRWLVNTDVKKMKNAFLLIHDQKKRDGEFYGSSISRVFREVSTGLSLNDRFEI